MREIARLITNLLLDVGLLKDEVGLLKDEVVKLRNQNQVLGEGPNPELHPMFHIPDYNMPLTSEKDFHDFETKLANPRLANFFVSIIFHLF